MRRCLNTSINRFIYASSAAVYGDQPPPLNEEMPVKPLSPYGASKAAAEAYCIAYHKTYGLKTTILRYMNVYGPGAQNSPYAGVITKLTEQLNSSKLLKIHGYGEQTRDFIHVNDIILANQLTLNSKRAVRETFIIGTGTPTSINHLAALILKIIGKNKKIIHRPPRKGDIKPRSKLFVYNVNDIIILKKMSLPDVKKEMQNLWNEVDKKIMKYGEVNEDEIQMEIEKHRAEKRRKDKGI